MTVRWRPLIVLSGFFLIIAVLGLIAFVVVPGAASDPLPRAHAEWQAKRFERAKIQFDRALQRDGRNPEIHEQMARMFADWADAVPARRAEMQARRLVALGQAAKYGKDRPAPRRALLADALQHEERAEALHWARELIAIEPQSSDANYALATEALDARPARLADARERLAVLEAHEPDRPRTAWVQARLALEARDEPALARLLATTLARPLPEDADAVDRMARLRLRLLDARRTTDPAALAGRVQAIRADAKRLAADPDRAPGRVALLGRLLDQAQEQWGQDARHAELEQVTESLYRQATAPSSAPDPKTYLAYAEHLLARRKRDACLDVVAKALKLPACARPSWSGTAMALREVGVKAALLDPEDASRFERATPYIQEMIAGSDSLYQGVGHLFQGVIDLERSGMADPPASEAATKAKGVDPKLQSSALKHLKIAAANLPKVGTAQALYGIALLLSRESALGRQYLQAAQRLGGLEPRYQVWGAWSMIQAGYPEDAAPIVAKLNEAVSQGKQPRALEPMLHLLQGEIHQARRTPAELRQALVEYQRALSAGGNASPALQLRIAQVEMLLGEGDAGRQRLAQLNAGPGSPSSEVLTVLALRERKQPDEARRRLADARRRYPDSAELAGLEAALLADAGQAQQADALLKAFLKTHPNDVDARLSRARLLASADLNQPEEARKVLAEVADGDRSAPLVQMALLDLRRRDFASAEKAIKSLRARWPESASADLLDAQMALAREEPRAAAGHLDEALRKDPSNKVALFWKAQLDDQAGATAEAAKVFETLAQDESGKELVDGLSLSKAAQWALATVALENQDVDDAIARFQRLLKDGVRGEADRQVRWQLALALAAKGQKAAAKTAIAALLDDPKTTPAERVQAANFYRLQDDLAAAEAQLELVLKADPGHAQAASLRALLLARSGRPAEAAAVLRAAMARGQQPPSLYLMLAATESLNPPAATGAQRTLVALEKGLEVYPDSVELVRAKYLALKLKKDPMAVSFVESRAQHDPTGTLRRLLVDTYRDEDDPVKAEAVLRGLLKQFPQDARVAATLIRVVAAQAERAARQGDGDGERRLEAEAAALVARFRKEFPGDLRFPQLDCELAIRHGDPARAATIAREIDQADPTSSLGPLLRARIFEAQGQIEQVAQAYAEALSRNPRQPHIRLALGHTSLALGQPDEAIRQADWLLQGTPDHPAALLLKARALAERPGTPAQVAARRDEALRSLRSALARHDKDPAFYHGIAEIERARGGRAEAVKALQAALKAVPNDVEGLARLVQYLSEPREGGQAAPRADVQAANRLAEERGNDANDPQGHAALALAVGFQKANQPDLALPWAEKAAAKLDQPVAHLTLGDILLAKAEATSEPTTARAVFERAVASYDRVLKVQATSIEAVNNKAWILHRYLGDHHAALALTEGLLRRSGPDALPAEFFDTLGSIQEATGDRGKAEASYLQGLRKAPSLAMLNFHMGRLLTTDPSRAGRAVAYLEKARAGRGELPESMAAEVDGLLRKASR